MQNEFDRDSGVTYIGPRSFVAGFAVVCVMFVAIVYGANRITGSLDSVPMTATIDLSAAPRTSAPRVASAPASTPSATLRSLGAPHTASSLATQAAKPGSFASPHPASPSWQALTHSNTSHAFALPHAAALHSPASPQSATRAVRVRLKAVSSRRVLTQAVSTTAAVGSTAAGMPRPRVRHVGTASSRQRPLAITASSTTSRQAPTAVRIAHETSAKLNANMGHKFVLRHAAPARAVVLPGTTTQVYSKRLPPASLTRQSLERTARSGAPHAQPPHAVLLAAFAHASRFPSGLLVPFRTAKLTSSSALEPRLAGRSPLVIRPEATP